MNWPLILLVIAILGLPGIIVALAKFSDWLERGPVGDWVRRNDGGWD